MQRRSFLASLLVAVGILKPREKVMYRGVEIVFEPPVAPGSNKTIPIYMADKRFQEEYLRVCRKNERRFAKIIQEMEDERAKSSI